MIFQCASRKLACVLVLSVLCLLAAPAQAAVNKKGAEHLRKMFERILQEQEKDIAQQGGSMKMDGKVLVEPSDKYYAITLPHLLISQPDGGRLDIGMIALNAMPTNKKGQWKMTMALPTPIVWHTAGDGGTVNIHIGRQNFAGIWHEEYEAYTKLQSQYQDVRVTSSDGKVNVSIGELKTVTDLNEDSNGYWSGPGNLSLSGLSIGGPQATFKIGSLEARTNIHAYDMKAAKTYQDNMKAVAEKYKAGETGATPEQKAGIYNALTGFLGAVWDGFDWTTVARDISLEKPATGTQPARTVRFGEQTLDFAMKGFRQGSVALRFALGYDRVSVSPAPEYSQTFPDRAKIDLEINKLPYNDIVALGRTAMEQQGQDPQALALQGLLSVPQLLTNAGTHISLRELSFGNQHYRTASKGILTADVQAAKGATGTGTTEIAGLEKLISLVQEQIRRAGSANPGQQEKLNKLLTTLTLVQMLGQQGTGANGQPARLYNFELTKDGKVLLNGTDLGMLKPQAAP